MVSICVVFESIHAQKLLFNYVQVSSDDSNPKIESYVSIRQSRDIPDVYGLRWYLRVSRVVFFRSAFYLQILGIGAGH